MGDRTTRAADVIFMRLALSLAIFAFAAMAADQPPVTVKAVVAFVSEGLAAKHDDKQIAKALSKVKLMEKLEAYPVEELESAGAGPKTLQELSRLREISDLLSLPDDPPKFTVPPMPTQEEMIAAIHHARVYALNYTARLPDFLCNEIVERFEDPSGKGNWDKKDVLGVRLGYLDHAEDYKLITVNGHPTTQSFQSMRGAWSEGEFGSLMLEIFDPNSHAQFHWDHWTHLRNHATQVYSYRVKKGDSHYKLAFGMGTAPTEVMVGEEGFVYLDGETSDIVRVTDQATDIPLDFPVRQAMRVLDYAVQDVGGKPYVLPLHAEVRMGTGFIHTKNEVLFSGFRKFQGESTITFDTDADDKTAKDPIKH
jgi:hypothetical protein